MSGWAAQAALEMAAAEMAELVRLLRERASLYEVDAEPYLLNARKRALETGIDPVQALRDAKDQMDDDWLRDGLHGW